MKVEKFKVFELTLKDGSKVITKTPSSKLSLNYAKDLAYHWANVDKNDVVNVIGIK